MNAKTEEIIKLKRDVIVTQVPFGNIATLPKGTAVKITQALGGTHTIIADGSMYRLENKDADALGKEVLDFSTTAAEPMTLEDKVWAALRTCYDPEIPINIVDLGLIYGVTTTPASNNKFDVTVRMTLTAPGCGMGPIIAADAEHKVARLPDVNTVTIDIVFDPPWDRSMISEEAKLELGIM